jgi:hypothetical protein
VLPVLVEDELELELDPMFGHLWLVVDGAIVVVVGLLATAFELAVLVSHRVRRLAGLRTGDGSSDAGRSAHEGEAGDGSADCVFSHGSLSFSPAQRVPVMTGVPGPSVA